MVEQRGFWRFIWLSLIIVLVPSGVGAADVPLRLSGGPHLLLDDFLIEKSQGLTRTVDRPRRDLAKPVVTGPEDKNWQPFFTVLRDDKTGQFRIWYNTPRATGFGLGTMTSNDGIAWERPFRGLVEPQNLGFGGNLLDDMARAGAPERRYKLIYWSKRTGIWLAHSPDGLGWKPDVNNPVARTGVNDISYLTWDPVRGRYLAILGMPSTPADGFKGGTANAPEGYRRCVGQTTSKDGVKWEKARYIFKPDGQDEGITEFYSIGGVVARGGLLVGLLKVLRDDLPCDAGGKAQGIGYTVLAWTRDGETWQRDRQPFLDRDPTKGAWDHAMAWGDCQVPVGNEVYLYYGGYARGHKVARTEERQIGLVRFPRDRYAAREAGATEGTLRTRLFVCDAEGLTANVDASKGTLRVQLSDEGGKPFPGFGFSDCEPISNDSLAAPVRWKKPLSDLREKAIRLEFRMKEARLFGFSGR